MSVNKPINEINDFGNPPTLADQRESYEALSDGMTDTKRKADAYSELVQHLTDSIDVLSEVAKGFPVTELRSRWSLIYKKANNPNNPILKRHENSLYLATDSVVDSIAQIKSAIPVYRHIRDVLIEEVQQ
jgi:hypothetical protein